MPGDADVAVSPSAWRMRTVAALMTAGVLLLAGAFAEPMLPPLAPLVAGLAFAAFAAFACACALLAVFLKQARDIEHERRVRQAAETAAVRSEARFARMFMLLPEVVTITDMDTRRYIAVNDAWTTVLGYSREETVGRTSTELGIWTRPEERAQLVLDLDRQGEVRDRAAQFRARDGRILECMFSGMVTLTDDARLLTLIVRDVTGERAAAREIEESRAWLRGVFDNSPAGIVVTEVESGVIAQFNRSAVAMYGLSGAPEQFIGRTGAEFGFWKSAEERLAHLAPVLGSTGGVTSEHALAGADGTARWIRSTAIRITINGGDYILSLMQDASAQKAADAALRASNERFERVFQSTPSPIVIIDLGSRHYVDVNQAWTDFTGHRRDDVIGRHVSVANTIVNPGNRDTMFARIMQGESVRGWADRYRKKDGSIAEVLASLEPLRVGDQTMIIASFADITEQIAAGREIRQLNTELERRVEERTAALTAANDELQSFTYTVSHDLRAPLRSIIGFSQIMLADHAGTLGDDGKRMLERSAAAAMRMGELIDALLALSNLSRNDLHFVKIDLTAVAWSVIAELRDADPGRRVTVDVEPGLSARADPVLVRSLLQNLLGNAWKYTGRAAEARIVFGGAPDGTGFVVRDNGAGFDMRYAGRLFEVFQRLHRAEDFEGIGVGLATAKRIVERHGGRIRAEGVTGEGATFYFTLG